MTDEQTKKIKVLLVDDDQFLLNMYALKFKNTGFEVTAAASGVLALEILRGGEKFDVIIFDIVMPTMDGFEFIEIVKKEKLNLNAALIALTNQGQTVDIERGKELGIDGYIVKASTIPSEVVKEVSLILEKRKANSK